jgi:hypothetical protein
MKHFGFWNKWEWSKRWDTIVFVLLSLGSVLMGVRDGGFSSIAKLHEQNSFCC